MKPKTFAELYQTAEEQDAYWIAGCVQEITEEIFELMERGGITRSELARRLEASPAYVTKILRGNANFTLATMVRLARALGAELQVSLKPAATVEPSDRKRAAPELSQRTSRGRRRSPAIAASPRSIVPPAA